MVYEILNSTKNVLDVKIRLLTLSVIQSDLFVKPLHAFKSNTKHFT